MNVAGKMFQSKGNSNSSGPGAGVNNQSNQSKMSMLFGNVDIDGGGATHGQKGLGGVRVTSHSHDILSTTPHQSGGNSNSNSNSTGIGSGSSGGTIVKPQVDLIAKNKVNIGIGRGRRASVGGYLPTVAEVEKSNHNYQNISNASQHGIDKSKGTSEAQRSSGYGHSSSSPAST